MLFNQGSSAGDGGGVVTLPDTTTNPTPEVKHTIKVFGKEQQVTTAELIERAQKGEAAEVRLQEAAELIRKNEQKIAIADAVAQMKNGGSDARTAFSRIAKDVWGLPDDTINRIESAYTEPPQNPVGGGSAAAPAAGGELMLQLQHLPPVVQDFFKPYIKAGMNPADVINRIAGVAEGTLEGNARDLVSKSIDSDPALRVYYNKTNDPQGTTRLDVADRIIGRAKAEGRSVPEVAREELGRIKATAQHVAKAVQRQVATGLPPTTGIGGPSLHPVTERPVFDPTKESEDHYIDRLMAYDRYVSENK